MIEIAVPGREPFQITSVVLDYNGTIAVDGKIPMELKPLLVKLRKLLPVHSVKLLNPENSIRRELILVKVNADSSEACNRVIQIANIFRASVIDVSTTTLTLAMIGEESKTEAIINLVKEFGILELVRTGMVALERGTDTIYEATKEKGEFDYGKNVL